MRLWMLRLGKNIFLGWRLFNLPTWKEERVLRGGKKILDTLANLAYKALLALAMVFELKRRREHPRRRVSRSMRASVTAGGSAPGRRLDSGRSPE